MTILFAHDNDVSNLKVGQVIPRGTRFYEEGTKGNVTGNHVHIECGKGKFTGSGWHKNESGYWSINNPKNPVECLWVDDSIKILNSNGYTFKKIENIKEEVTDNQNNTSTRKIELVFTCKKSGLYAIELKENEKLYIE